MSDLQEFVDDIRLKFLTGTEPWKFERQYYRIPDSTYETIVNYVVRGWRPGDFLTAVLSNRLMDAMARADENNQTALKDICGFIYNQIPAWCWGSSEEVVAWIEAHRNSKVVL